MAASRGRGPRPRSRPSGRRRSGPGRPAGGAAATLALAALLGAACALPGADALRGARLYGSGSEALERGETARAVAELERAAELVPRASEVQNHLGAAYAAAGRHEAALRAFRRAVALDCDNRAARRNLRAAERRAILRRGTAAAGPEAPGPP